MSISFRSRKTRSGGVLPGRSAPGWLLWDATTQQPLGGPLTTPGEKIHTLAFSPDSATLYAGSAHVPLQRCTLAPAQVVTHVCARAGGTLTAAQWHTYIPDAPDRRICGPADAR